MDVYIKNIFYSTLDSTSPYLYEIKIPLEESGGITLTLKTTNMK